MNDRDVSKQNKGTTILIVVLFCLCLILGGFSKLRESYDVPDSSLTETTEHNVACRECGTAIPSEISENQYHYCYSCGARMTGEQDETFEH